MKRAIESYTRRNALLSVITCLTVACTSAVSEDSEQVVLPSSGESSAEDVRDAGGDDSGEQPATDPEPPAQLCDVPGPRDVEGSYPDTSTGAVLTEAEWETCRKSCPLASKIFDGCPEAACPGLARFNECADPVVLSCLTLKGGACRGPYRALLCCENAAGCRAPGCAPEACAEAQQEFDRCVREDEEAGGSECLWLARERCVEGRFE